MKSATSEIAGGLRAEIDAAISREEWPVARSLLIRFWELNPGPAAAGFALPRLEKLRPHLSTVPCRLAILRSFTVEPVVPILRTLALLRGIDLTVRVGGFNAHAQELLDPAGGLYQFAPDIVILAVQTRDAAPELWDGWAELPREKRPAAAARVVDDFAGWLEAYRSHCRSPLIVHSLEKPSYPDEGILDSQTETGQLAAIDGVNREILRLLRDYSGIYLLDYENLVSRHGRRFWRDEEKWLTARLPIAADGLRFLAEEWLRFIHPLTGKIGKVLAVDLDNTLWGGVVGEEGMEGIQLGPEYPGAAYRDLQRAILDLHRRGVILAVCSKNNPEDARPVLEGHPGMLLRPEHFAAFRIDWRDKATNLAEIARELNVGPDALVFLDDNPAERQLVRTRLPEVNVIELPDDPLRYAETLRNQPLFERLVLSDEDRARGRFYAEQRLRGELARGEPTLEDFYRSLAMEAEIFPVSPATTARIAQLTRKTNQFNLTTRRYDEETIRRMAGDPSCRIFGMRLRDRFGDNGIVGAAITFLRGEAAEIDTFLLSCRVIGRTAETTLLAVVAGEVRRAGAKRLVGRFIPTAKNKPCREFYPEHGFRPLGKEGEVTGWELDLEEAEIAAPPWITIRPAEQGTAK